MRWATLVDSQGRVKESGLCSEPLWQVGGVGIREVVYTVGHFSINNVLPRRKVVYVLSHFLWKLRSEGENWLTR